MLRSGVAAGASAHGSAGFTLVEVILAIVILVVTGEGALLLFNAGLRQLTQSSTINEINALVEADAAMVRTANDRLVCATGACRIASADLSKDAYFPLANPADPAFSQANLDFFASLCDGTNTTTSFPGELNRRLPAADGRIVREIRVADEEPGHRYSVIYSDAATGRVIRTLTLVPATVAWCPANLND